ncbi:hypothetical protein [Polyangium sp. 6x1]|uniref:hypothetical protein n=1 Tax=Polyangium sp. 6x1 TaxID=3042689 RepID=UPI0024832236|nr:hypothetical protein [Polyangium sp. 6x1]MDI1445943.1 hypothetical protein [Polyangium sp. 6x1]
MVSVTEIDSEKERNVVETDPALEPSNHCVVIMEQLPLTYHEPAPTWRVSVALTIRDAGVFGKLSIQADLPTVIIGPLLLKRQIVAVARYPGRVASWSFRFESDAGRAKALVWLHPGVSPTDQCGIHVVQHARFG